MIQNKEVEQLMQKEGVAVIPFLFPEELEKLRAFFNEIQAQYDLQYTHGMHMTLWHSDVDFKLKIQNGLLEILDAAYHRNFAGCRRLNNIFMVKQAGTVGEFAAHNDWSIVDESIFSSINIWIPLQDVTTENGALWVLKGSHKIDMPIRGGGALLPDFKVIDESLKEYREPIDARAGDAILFYHKTVHGSYPNKSNKDRVVCTFSIIPQESTLQIWFQLDEHSPLEIHRPADDFNYKYKDLLNDTNSFAPTKEPYLRQSPYKQKKVVIEEILPLLIKK
jgi:hypothetical protein